jgi:MFS family permease
MDVLVVILINLGYGIIDISLAPHLHYKFNYTESDVAEVFILITVLYAVTSFSLSCIIDKLPKKRLISICVLIHVLFFVLVSDMPGLFPDTSLLIVIGVSFSGIGGSVGYSNIHIVASLPSMFESAVQICRYEEDDRLRDALSALLAVSVSGGEILGPLLGGCLIQFMNFSMAFVAAAILASAVLVLYLSVFRRVIMRSHIYRPLLLPYRYKYKPVIPS